MYTHSLDKVTYYMSTKFSDQPTLLTLSLFCISTPNCISLVFGVVVTGNMLQFE